MPDLRGRPKGRKERLQRLIGDIRTQTHPYTPRAKKPRDWHRYDEAQAHEIADVLEMINLLIDQLPDIPYPVTAGRPRSFTPKDRAKLTLMQQVFHTSNRTSRGYARIVASKLGLRVIPSYKTIERAYADPLVFSLIAQVFDQTVRIASGSITGYTLDGSGIATSVKGNWERDKSEDSAAALRFDGAVAMVGLPVQVVTAYVQRPIGFTSEVNTPETLVEKTVRLTGGLRGIVSADAGFQSRANCDLFQRAGGTPRILPRRNVSFKSLGSEAWAPMLTALLRDSQCWLREYHQRSLSETGWAVYKNQFPRPLRRRLKRRRACEHLARFAVYNLVRLSRSWRTGALLGPAPWVGRLN